MASTVDGRKGQPVKLLHVASHLALVVPRSPLGSNRDGPALVVNPRLRADGAANRVVVAGKHHDFQVHRRRHQVLVVRLHVHFAPRVVVDQGAVRGFAAARGPGDGVVGVNGGLHISPVEVSFGVVFFARLVVLRVPRQAEHFAHVARQSAVRDAGLVRGKLSLGFGSVVEAHGVVERVRVHVAGKRIAHFGL